MADDKERELEELRARLATYESRAGTKAAPAAPDVADKASSGSALGGCLLMIMVLLGLVWMVSTCSGKSDAPVKSACDDDVGAYYMSQTFVERQLKAPGTAEFPSLRDEGVSVRSTGVCEFTVVAYVDAENSFGAKLRSSYVAVLQAPTSGDTWTLKSVVID